MAFIPDFSATQTIGLPSKINFTDISTGTDLNITSRRIYLLTSSGTYLVQTGTTTSYEVWAYTSSTITLTVLSKDYALDILVQWLDISNNVLYEKTHALGFTLYNETFDYGLTQMLAANVANFNDAYFFRNKSNLRIYIDSGNKAVELASDIYDAQLCYDEATKLRLKSQYIFNINN